MNLSEQIFRLHIPYFSNQNVNILTPILIFFVYGHLLIMVLLLENYD